jgi:hypothetical protein
VKQKIVTIMTTSLQRRSNNGNTNSNGIKGAFESCFAQGLDLSEFDAASSSSSTTRYNHTAAHVAQPQQFQQPQRPCASAELLPIIQKRAQERHYNEQEELRLHQTIQKRAWNIQQQLNGTATATVPISSNTIPGGGNSNSKDTNAMLSLTDTLVAMHGKDDNGGAKTTFVKKATGGQAKKHTKPKGNLTRHDRVLGRQQQSLKSHGVGIQKGVIPKGKRIKYH